MTTLLVDGNNLLARADFAAKNRHIEMSANGVNTAALVLFVNMLSKYVRLTRPERIHVCWDAGHKMRDDLYPEYKAARKQRPSEDSPDTQPFAQAKEFLTLAGISHRCVLEWEADDLIALYCRTTPGKIVILSGDKDLLQLVHDDKVGGGKYQTTQIRPPDEVEWTEETVKDKFGIEPHLLPQYLALVGDPGDGVPGLRGIGPKKAVKMISEAEGDWEVLLAALSPEKAAEARLMHSLVDLRTCEYPWWVRTALEYGGGFYPTIPEPGDALSRFCERYQLASIHERLVDGSLWAAEHPKPLTEALFEDFDLDSPEPTR